MNLSFFAAKPYQNSRDKHLMHGSSAIRAEQVAHYLGAKLNPSSGYENDVCVFVKPADNGIVSKNYRNRIYLDIVDHKEYVKWLHEHPGWFGIATSLYGYNCLKDELPGRITLIPQQHCNFERFERNRNEITAVGIIGRPKSFHYPIEEIRQRLEKIGLRLETNFIFQTREDVVNFYKNIDIQIIWYARRDYLKNPLKIVNAASFGIPTIGYPLRGYQEVEGYYIKVRTVDQLINEAERLKNPENYAAAIKNLRQMAEKYHISKIAELYKNLAPEKNILSGEDRGAPITKRADIKKLICEIGNSAPTGKLYRQENVVPHSAGIIYYTHNQIDEKIMKACQEQLKKSAGGRKIVSVSLRPVDFGKNIVLSLEAGYLTMFEQILAGLEALDTDIVFFCEHDVLYHPIHFNFRPADRKTFYYNGNFWMLRIKDGFAVHYDCMRLSGLACYREAAVNHFRERVEMLRKIKKENLDFCRRYVGFEPFVHNRVKWKFRCDCQIFMPDFPNIDISHETNATRQRWGLKEFTHKPKIWEEGNIDTIPGWENLRSIL